MKLTTYSFRADMVDVTHLLNMLAVDDQVFTCNLYLNNKQEPHVELAIGNTLEELRDKVRRVCNYQMILQTLRKCPLKDNSLEQDHSLE